MTHHLPIILVVCVDIYSLIYRVNVLFNVFIDNFFNFAK